MPRISDTIAIKNPELKRSCKLSDSDKLMIKTLHDNGESIRSLSRLFKVSRRLVQFILYPDRQKRSMELRQARGGSKIYYEKEKHTIAVRKHRDYKKILYKAGLIG